MLRNHTFCTRFRAFRPARLVSLLLAALLVFSALPAVASGLSAGEGAESGTMAPEAVISAEDISRRGDFEKHYLLSDGSFVAVSYAEAVHYRDANGEWAEVDNTLTRNASSGRITNSYGRFGVSFADSAAANAADGTVSISYGGDTLSWTLSTDSGTSSAVQAGFSAQIIGAGEASAHAAAGRSVSDAEAFTSAKLSGRVSYTGLLAANPEIAVNYTVFHNKIEEDIILTSPTDARVFTLDVKCGTLSARVEEDNSVVFLSEQGEVCFRIGIPYMEDAAGEVLNDIAVSAVRTSGGWAVSYTPDEEWLRSDERVYPILLDPSVTTGEYVSNIADTYVYRGNTADHSSEQRLYVGVKNGNVYRTFLKINNLPSIAANMPITGATLKLTRVSGTSTGKTVKLYRCGQSWSPSGVTYANQPGSLTYIGYSDFSSSTNYYSFSLGSYASSMFTDFAAGNYFGYMLRYGDESTTNPDYNILYSSEYTDSGSRPLLTVTYGYSLPSGLVNGGVYAFRNAGSGSYMTVHNGNDANAVNVYQKKISSTSALGDAQRFKLEYVSSTGGYYLRAMCSSEGTNRVLDIVKSGGYVKSGCNVQIHTAIDPLAQHWFIVAVSGGTFRIVPRTAMNLSLTSHSSADGTSGGTTSSSDGNIYVSETSTTWNNLYQQWEIFDENGGANVSTTGTIANGTYYFNNPLYGKYLGWDGSADNSVKGRSGYISEFGNNIRWKLTNVSGKKYTIQSARDTSQYLTSPGYFPIMSALPSGGTIPDKFLWEITVASGGGMLIKNVAYGTYLQTNSAGSLHLDSFGSTDSDRYQYSRWRMISTSQYGNTGSFSKREFSNYSSFENCEIGIGETARIVVNKCYSAEIWCSPEDFTYTIESASVVGINSSYKVYSKDGKISGSRITATHKVTNIVKQFYVIVGYSSTISSTPLAENIVNGLNQPYCIWPASSESTYYTAPDSIRRENLADIYSRANLTITGGELLNYPRAAEMLRHYIGNTGSKYTLNFKDLISEWSTARNYRAKAMNDLMRVVEISATTSNKTIKTVEPIACSVNESSDCGWSIGSYSTSISCTYKKNGNSYIAVIEYELHDAYDWDRTVTSMGHLPVSPHEMWELHHGGYAKNYEVYGKNTFTLTWTSGQTFTSEGVMTNEE